MDRVTDVVLLIDPAVVWMFRNVADRSSDWQLNKDGGRMVVRESCTSMAAVLELWFLNMFILGKQVEREGMTGSEGSLLD